MSAMLSPPIKAPFRELSMSKKLECTTADGRMEKLGR